MSREIILINVSGQDRPGFTAALGRALAATGVDILDIGQSVIHDELNFGVLVEIPAGAESASILKDMLFAVHRFGGQARFTPIDADQYADWAAQHGRPRYIVTLLARRITAEHLARVTDEINRHGLTVDAIRRLSGRLPLEPDDRTGRASVELSVRGYLADQRALRADLLGGCSGLGLDISVQEDNVFRRNRRMVAFDMDSTLIQVEVIDELARLAGVGDEVQAITAAAMRGELDFDESLRRRVGRLAGLDAAVLDRLARTLPLTEGVERLVRTLRRYGYKTAILSGGFIQIGERLREQLGIDYVHANELEIVDGRLTGRVVGDIVNGPRKAALLREIAGREGIDPQQVIAVGDGANDLPMLGAAGLGIAFHAKPVVARSADHAISELGLDGVLYLIGFTDQDIGEGSG